jgi:hypothetical protein
MWYQMLAELAGIGVENHNGDRIASKRQELDRLVSKECSLGVKVVLFIHELDSLLIQIRTHIEQLAHATPTLDQTRALRFRACSPRRGSTEASSSEAAPSEAVLRSDRV